MALVCPFLRPLHPPSTCKPTHRQALELCLSIVGMAGWLDKPWGDEGGGEANAALNH